ncbi:MAG: 4Fe-4S dicluster domain-containing protein [Myxococcota bacterium]|jgi:molybdopterin-containing oxidoreductase family iron-sulfur binding subunit|nr:4Fe-4S dicluster domain-containing protein [Myxococcota bacterium]
MSELNRRSFLQVLGVTGASSLAACDPKVPLENALPYVVTPDQIVPGLSTWFSTRCNECAAGCGVMARNREGRVVKLEGNPDHPTSGGNLCAAGQAGLQAPYSPDRFEGPMKAGAATDWDTALTTVKEAVAAADGKVAWLGSTRTGSLGALIHQFVDAVGGTEVHWEPLGTDALRAASRKVYGRDETPAFRLESAHTIVSFGADFLGTWLSPLTLSRGYADSRDPAVGDFVSRLVCVEPRVGTTSAMADLHLAARPGTEAGVALAIAKLLAEKNGYQGPASGVLRNIDAHANLQAAEVSDEAAEKVAGWMAAGHSVALPGGVNTSGSATDLAVATLVLNEVAGNVGDTVVYGPSHNHGAASSYAEVEALVKDCAAGNVNVLFVDGLDPAHALPAELGVLDALSKVALVVAFDNEASDSQVDGALVLPPGSTLETWGDGEAVVGIHTLQQPAMKPLKDTRSVGDVLLALSSQLSLGVAPVATEEEGDEAGADVEVEAEDSDAEQSGEDGTDAPALVLGTLPGLDSETYLAYLKAWWEAVVWHQAGKPGTAAAFWTESLKRGGHFREEPVAQVTFALEQAPGSGSSVDGDGLVLTLFPHPFLHDGRHANKPWAQEVPEPLSTFTWGTWAEIHPDTAHELGLHEEHGVVVSTDKGEIEVGWFGSPGVRTDTVAVVMGNGHERSGRYTRYGANPLKLVSSSADEDGAQLLVTTRAKVRSSSQDNLYAQAGSLTQEGRPINFTSKVSELEHADGAGSIVHPHHVPVDERLIEHGLHDMYPEPEHPTYRFAMAVDLNRCTGCGACETACFAENNLSVLGPEEHRKSRHMGWIRLSRYWEGGGEHPDVRFQPVMCQQCSHAPCEGVCPVLATYHNLDGLNAMIYNRCVGTRYCANNCPYTARRFNYHTYLWPEPFQLMLNPDVSTREMGVMEKCSFCSQRIRAAKDEQRDVDNRTPVSDEVLRDLPACVQACPADAMVFGNVKDEQSTVYQKYQDPRAYTMLGELNTKPGVRYLARLSHAEGEEEGHGSAGGHH